MEDYIQERKLEQIFSFLKRIKGIHSKNEKRLRIFMEAVFYTVRSGCQWRLLPEIYGNYRSIHKNPNYGLANKESAGDRRLFGFQGI